MNCQCQCDCCCKTTFEDKPLRLRFKDIKEFIKDNVGRIRGLNKPYTISGRVFGNVLHLIDSSIGLLSLGYVGSNFGTEYIIRDLDKFAQYDENRGSDFKFKLKPFRFKLFKMGKVSKPSTRSRKYFGHALRLVDSLIGIITFGNFDSFIYHELKRRDLNRLGRFIERYGVEGLRNINNK